jgi:hypothetical protein
VRQVRVHYVGSFLPQPVMEFDPSPRVCQPSSHFQAQEIHACVAQIVGCCSAMAGQRHHAHAPAAPA